MIRIRKAIVVPVAVFGLVGMATMPPSASAATAKLNGSCPKAGQTTTVASRSLVCTKVKSKLVWLAAPAATTAGPTAAVAAATVATTAAPTAKAPAKSLGELLAPQPLAKRQKLNVSGSAGRPENTLAFLYALETGEFDKENLEISYNPLPATDSLALLAQGKLDVVSQGVTSGGLNLISQGTKLRAVYPLGYPDPKTSQEGFWVRKSALGDDGVFQPSDIKGQRLLVPNPQAGLVGSVYQSLQAVDPSFKQSDLIPTALPLPDIGAALQTGAGNVGLVLSPLWADVKRSGCCVPLPGAYPVGPLGWYAFGPTMLDPANRDAATAFVRVLMRTTYKSLGLKYRSDRNSLSTIAKALGVEPVDLGGLPEIVFPLQNIDSKFFDTTLRDSQVFFLSQKDVLQYSKPLASVDIFDRSFIDRVVAAG